MPTLTDESSATFESVGNLGVSTDPMLKSVAIGREASVHILDPSEKLEVSGSHDFRLSMKLDPSGGKSDRRDDGPAEATKSLTFHFSIPVHNMDVIDVGQTVETNRIRMTLDWVENSPARTEAFLCFDPPQDEKYNWSPWVKRPNIAQSDVFINDSLLDIEPKEAVSCVGYDLFRSLYDKVGAIRLP
jgi:hypothetical protein